jgi:hypothetical protein
MEEPVKRDYSLEDEALLTKATTIFKTLETKLADFTAKFSWVDAAFLADFGADITAAKNSVAQQVLASNKKVMTEEGFRALHVLGTYAALAYPQDLNRRLVFGQEHWRAARVNRKKMFDVLTQAYSLASQDPYKTELANKGFTPADENLLRDLAELLDEKKIPQLNAMKEKRILTADRVVLHNKVYATMKTLKLCARLVYRDDYALRRIFNLTPPHAKGRTFLKVLVLSDTLPLPGAGVKLLHLRKPRLTNEEGYLLFDSRKMPAKIEGEVVHPSLGTKSFMVEIKSGKRNRVVVEM